MNARAVPAPGATSSVTGTANRLVGDAVAIGPANGLGLANGGNPLIGVALTNPTMDATVSDPHARWWHLQARRACAWYAGAGHWPCAVSLDPAERSVALWLGAQAHATTTGSSHHRLMLLDQRLPGWRAAPGLCDDATTRLGRWLVTADRFASWLRTHGRSPRPGTDDPQERALFQWLCTQPDDEPHHAYLDAVAPGWDLMVAGVRAEQQIATWYEMAVLLQRWVRTHSAAPRALATDPEERDLAVWLTGQLERRADLGAAERIVLDRIAQESSAARPERAPAQDDSDGAWRARAEDLAAFVAQRGRWPRRYASNEDDRLAQWLYRQRRLKRAGHSCWTDERQRLLDELAPGWLDGKSPRTFED